jgi:phytoene dehydrogenase-like protein
LGGLTERLEIRLPAPVSELAGRHWDTIVVGAGHNGLAAAAYLGRAGRRVLVLERRDRVGGACTLERPFADARYVISPCAYVVGLLDELVISELRLRERGLQIRLADPELFIPFEDGTAFVQWLEAARTEESLRSLGVAAADIRGFHAYSALFNRARELLRDGKRDAWMGDSPTREEVEELLGGQRELIDLVFEASIAEVLDAHISDQRLKDALAPQGLIAAYGGPRDPGTAWIHLMHHMGNLEGSGGSWGYVTGGIGVVSATLCEAAREAGAVVACDVPVARIAPEEGVELEDGTAIRAREVVCNADPKVLRRLLDGAEVPDEFARRLDEWKVRSPVVKVNAALRGLPRWTAADGETWPAQGQIDITSGVDGAQAAFEACERGEFELGYCELYCQTAADPSPAPPDRHLMSAFCQYAPYEPAAGPWDDALRDRVGRDVVAAIECHAPGFGELIEELEVLGPPDIEKRIGLTGGQIFQGECFPEQIWEGRMAARTPLDGVYLCGAATHPGGSVIGLNGRNAAAAVLADSGESLPA